ncbi:bZIP transcription factor 60 [Prunus yedoensis var. nudiflora]|uniref:BZIP transcription factor 60 n=1 Tax=Prunus yedoensis var. nudiflora TaxID=2094558 RepID=A0A314ZIN7_PRUYE|nr:bZIP transcription factor 60 [Prunus yedoensis var. nudiflora]
MESEGDVGFLESENDIIGEIDWDILFDGPNTLEDVLELENPVVTATNSSSPSPSPSSTVEDAPSNSSPDWIGEIETILMKDDDVNGNQVDSDSVEPTNAEYYEKFLADILVNSPSTDADSNASADSEKEKLDRSPLNDDDDDDAADADAGADDPISKKRRRQLRNKDAAVRSRERKKMYVRDLEMKSKYLEGECRRLGRLLQCCYAENHALRLGLQMNNAYGHGHGVLVTKQESAVLLLELLLLGSLLRCLDIMCLVALPLILMAGLRNPLNNVAANKDLESVDLRPRGAASKMFQHSVLQCFSKSRRCKASRTKMKHSRFPCLLGSYVSFALPLLMLAT